jgi:undecaprenyl-diphosphatase
MHALELTWIYKLHDALRSPCLDQFMYTWRLFDTFGFAMLLIGIIWYLINQQIGIRLFYILLLSSIVNILAKHLFELPRPCQIDPSVGIYCIGSPGFPSGAAQTAILLSGILFIESRKRLYHILGVIFAIIFCFSRVYLGVHFFTDILGGLAIGSLLLAVYKKGFPLAKQHWESLSFLLPFVLLFLSSDLLMFQFGVALGVAIGLSLNMKNPMTRKSLLQCITAILGAFFLMKIAKNRQHDLIGFFAIMAGLWFSYGAAWAMYFTKKLFFQFKKTLE